jgi:tetratricopeptide (TPR) repeat protein
MEQTFPYVLEKLLNSKADGSKFDVIALGVRGHRLVDNFLKLLIHGQTLKPDLVIFQFFNNDIEFYDYPRIFTIHKLPDMPSAYLSKIAEIMKEDSFDWQVFQEVLGEVDTWSQQSGIPVGFVVFPPLERKKSGTNFDGYTRGRFIADVEKMERQIRKHPFPVLSLMDVFRKEAGDRYLALSETDGHPNRLAHRLTAEALIHFVSEFKLPAASELSSIEEDPLWEQEQRLRKEAEESWLKFNQNHVEQLEFFRKLQQLYPDDPWTVSLQAQVYFGLGRWDDAFTTFRSINDLCPAYAAPWYQMALSTADREKKREHLGKMLQFVPDHIHSMEILANLYLEDGRIQSACELLSNVMKYPITQEQFDTSKQLREKHECK